MPGINFEKVFRDDGLEEERVIREGEEHPLRRAVGMPAFTDSAEAYDYIEHQEESGAEASNFKDKLTEGIQAVFERNKGEPHLRSVIWAHLSKRQAIWPDISLDNVRYFEVTPDNQGAVLTLKHPKYGQMTFRLGSEEKRKEGKDKE
jgi:hypothetical protein